MNTYEWLAVALALFAAGSAFLTSVALWRANASLNRHLTLMKIQRGRAGESAAKDGG